MKKVLFVILIVFGLVCFGCKKEKENKNTSRIIDEADYVVDELCSKVVGSNNRILELPLKIEYRELLYW